MANAELRKRVAVASVGIPFAFLLVYVGGWPLAVVLALVSAGVAWELFLLAEANGARPFVAVGVFGAAGMPLLAGVFRAFPEYAPWGFGLIVFLLLLTFALSVWLRWPQDRPLAATAITLVGAVYAGGCMAFPVFIRHLPESWNRAGIGFEGQGALLLAFPLLVTWIGDSAAYFLGKRFGKGKLLPAVSPGKTRVGGVAGLAFATASGVVLGWLVLGMHSDPRVGALFGGMMGLLLGAGAQVGDLIESVVKREAQVKDSGRILPGHGGLLDRFDALLFNFPLAYLLFSLTAALP